MKKTLFLIFGFLFPLVNVYSGTEIDSLLKELDKTIAKRQIFSLEKTQRIDSIKQELNSQISLKERYLFHDQIISEYESFICDSALVYIYKNIQIAEELNNEEYLYTSKLKLSFVLSLSGLFTQALEVFDDIDYSKLSYSLKLLYHWSCIRYYENLMKYTEDSKYGSQLLFEKKKHRDTLMTVLEEGTDMYVKEQAFIYQDAGKYREAAEILTKAFIHEAPSSHGYAMGAMSLAIVHKHLGNSEQEEKFLILASITDNRLAVKENEALLTLAIYRYQKGDVNRAYTYIRAALDDANFYNSRFRNTVISRVQPIIEATYLSKIEQQKKNLRTYATIISVFAVVLIGTLYFLYRQMKIVSRARLKLKNVNKQLAGVNQNLDEANLIKERYIGYYINQCAVYLDKLDEYRKNVTRKIKTGQIEDLYNLSLSTQNLEKDAQELYSDFDKTFFEIYPNFVEEFNSLLREEEKYKLKKNQLNTELRIFALIRLGITDVNQIAIFLRYSIQTIYNYKSKVKGKAIIDSEIFEDKVKEIGASHTKINSTPFTK